MTSRPSSVCFRAVPSPQGIEAGLPGEVLERAVEFGASFFGVRPSTRSFSCWVAIAWFTSPSTAKQFSLSCQESFSLPFCFVRSMGGWWLVSVPVLVYTFESQKDTLPLMIVSLSS